MSPQVGSPSAMAPVPRLLWLRSVLRELDLDDTFLQPASDLADRASQMRSSAVLASSQAAARRGQALQQLASDPEATIADAAKHWAEAGVWLDAPPGGFRPPAVELSENAARLIEGQVAVCVLAHSEKLFVMAKKRAEQAIAEIEALPPWPAQIWQVSNPSDDLGRIHVHRKSWGVLVAARNDFNSCHRIADLCRDSIGAGVNRLPGGAPRESLIFRNWRAWLDDSRYGELKSEMKLAYAVAHKWEPGIWRPTEIETKPSDASFGKRLSQLGTAVGINW
jgi:hypothetical protein